MRLFDFIEQDNRIRLSAHLFRQLTRFVITDIAGRRTDQTRNGMFLHKLGHIEPDERFRRIEQFFGKELYKLGFADARGTDENKRSRAALYGKLDTAALNCRRHQIDRFVLPDKVRFQAVFHADQTLNVALHDFCGGNPRPKVNDFRQILFGDGVVGRFFFELRLLMVAGNQFRADVRQRGIFFVFLGLVVFGFRRSDKFLFFGFQLVFVL